MGIVGFATRVVVLVYLPVALALTECSAQSLAYSVTGPGDLQRVGYSVDGAGDVNRDGFADVILGSDPFPIIGPRFGTARVISGIDGSTLFLWTGDLPGDEFGNSVAGVGDVNGDGFDDVVVGSPGGISFARVYSGFDGSALFTVSDGSIGEGFGSSVSDAGDLNGDGFADFGVRRTSGPGSVYFFSGLDGALVFALSGSSDGDDFGRSFSGVGDFNNDGFDDVVIGAPGDDSNGPDAGSVSVYSGMDGCVLFSRLGDEPGRGLGLSFRAGDRNHDGFDDIVIAGSGMPSGLQIFSGSDGSILSSLPGVVVSGPAGDVDGDDVMDYLVVRFDSIGIRNTVVALSGVNGSDLFTLTGASPPGGFGFSLASAGDINGDRLDDVVVGQPFVGGGCGGALIFLSPLSGSARPSPVPACSPSTVNDGLHLNILSHPNIGESLDVSLTDATGSVSTVLYALGFPASSPLNLSVVGNPLCELQVELTSMAVIGVSSAALSAPTTLFLIPADFPPFVGLEVVVQALCFTSGPFEIVPTDRIDIVIGNN